MGNLTRWETNSPNPANTVFVEDPFIADNGDVLRQCLSDQHPIEGIFMLAGNRSGALTMLYSDGKLLKAEIQNPVPELHREPFRFRQLANPHLCDSVPGVVYPGPSLAKNSFIRATPSSTSSWVTA